MEIAIPLLQSHATLHSLEVVEHRFRLDTDHPTRAADLGVPRAAIVRDRQRHFGPPSQIVMEAEVQTLEEADLAGVADRVPGRECLKPDIDTDDSADAGECPKIDRLRDSSFDPPDG